MRCSLYLCVCVCVQNKTRDATIIRHLHLLAIVHAIQVPRAPYEQYITDSFRTHTQTYIRQCVPESLRPQVFCLKEFHNFRPHSGELQQTGVMVLIKTAVKKPSAVSREYIMKILIQKLPQTTAPYKTRTTAHADVMTAKCITNRLRVWLHRTQLCVVLAVSSQRKESRSVGLS